MNILEEFWYGNIEPAEYDISSSNEYKELLQLISRNEDKLLATMTEEQKELFTKYADCVREYQVMAECLLFQNSFRLGGRMMLEVMRSATGNPCRWTLWHMPPPGGAWASGVQIGFVLRFLTWYPPLYQVSSATYIARFGGYSKSI